MFHPGETISHTFTLPYNKSEINQVIISYRQNEQIILEKIITSENSMQDGEEEDTTIVSAILSEDESLLFHDNTRYGIQVNVFFGDGKRASGRVTSDEINGESGLQHIRELGEIAGTEGFGQMYIDDDGYLVYMKSQRTNPFSIDNDGFLIINREVV